MPKIFYKYKPINQFTDRLLNQQEVYFAFGHEYIDPFDSKVRICFSSSEKDILNKLDTTPLPLETKESIRSSILSKKLKPEQYLWAAYKVAKTTIMSSCFSEDNLNVLMWSHYADSHKGICLGFANVSTETVPAMKFDLGEVPGDPPTLKNGVFPLTKVNYDTNEIIIWEPFKNDISIFMEAHTKKAKYWQYEKEHRIILPYKEYQTKILRFDKRFLREIYFGAKVSEIDKAKYLAIIQDQYIAEGIPVKAFQIKLSELHFDLKFEEI